MDVLIVRRLKITVQSEIKNTKNYEEGKLKYLY